MLVAQLADNNDDDIEWSTTMDACEARVYYAPTKGNVLFASASDGWAFSINDFVNILSTKMPQLSVDRLRERLYDADYYYSSKKQEIISGASKSDRKPLFVQLVLDSIWSVYRAIVIDKDTNRTRMLCEQIGVMLNARDERHADPNVRVCALMQAS
jgi:ribosome assembly protein 1